MIATLFALLGRLLLALLFLVEGINKLLETSEAREAFAAAGVSPGLVLPMGIAQIILAILLAAGAWTRTVALVLATLTLLETLFFYNQFTDAAISAIALRNLAIVGGLLTLFAYGQTRWGYDALRERRRAELAERDRALRAQQSVYEEGVAEHYANRRSNPDWRQRSDRPLT